MKQYANIFIREPHLIKKVSIGSKDKPDVVKPVLENWQSMLDIAADIIQVPAGLIMRLNENSIEVFLKSLNKENPYKLGEKAELKYGLYCETVIGTQKSLIVPDARKDKLWKENNPDVEINMVSYIGFPLNWPDGEVFGTICMLDNKENNYNKQYSDFISQLKDHIEADLRMLHANQQLEKVNKELNELNTVKTRFLSLISHDIRGSLSAFRQVLKLTIDNINAYNKSELSTLLGHLADNVGSTYQTLENLLSWSRRDLLDLQPEKTGLNLTQILDEVLSFYQQAISLKEIEIIQDYEITKAFIHADYRMISSSLRNILSNAIKYNKQRGKIVIRLKQPDNSLLLEIEDTGLGMDKSILDNLFTLNKMDNSGKEASARIGLLIAKDFLDKNDVKISTESKVGVGTTITLAFFYQKKL